MARATASTSSGAQSKSGNPCDRLIAPCSAARRDITAKMLTPVDGSFEEMESVRTVMLCQPKRADKPGALPGYQRPSPEWLSYLHVALARQRHAYRGIPDHPIGPRPHSRSVAGDVPHDPAPAPGRGEDAHPAPAGKALEMVLGYRSGGCRRGRRLGARGR